MRKTLSFLAMAVIAGSLASGCANVEKKFGRGMMNMTEIVRGGELTRTMEQTALTDGSDAAYGIGFVRGINRVLLRTGVGIFEVVTAPIPPYDPLFRNNLAPGPVYPDAYAPGLRADSMFSTDASLGFSGGDVVPMVPGSRFRIFDNH